MSLLKQDSGGISDKEYDFLDDTLQDIDGIGKQGAAKIISIKNNFTDFSGLNRRELEEIGQINNEQATGVLEKINNIDFSMDVRILFTKRILESFLAKQYDNLRDLSLDDLDVNILLIKALGFTTAEEAIKFNLYQRITRSTVTSWGGQGGVEKVSLVSGAEKISQGENVSVSGKKFDIKKEVADKTFYIQVKSGPNTMNIGMVDSLNQMIEKIEEKHEDGVGVLGMTYGKPERVSGQIRRTLNNFDKKSYIGSDFWELVSGEEQFFGELISLIDEISTEIQNDFNLSFLQLAEEKQQELEEEWEGKYGALGSEGLSLFIDQYID